MGVERQGVEIV
jgi:7-keto-8-aminopelargonate synthetase-like enzyme